jgi:hypothetical protein
MAALVARAQAKERDEWRQSALICSVIANVNRNSKKRRKPFQPDDFIGGRQSTKKQTPDQMLSMVEQMNAELGGKDERKGVSDA